MGRTILPKLAMLDHFEIIKLLQSIMHHWKGILLRYIMVSVVWLYVISIIMYMKNIFYKVFLTANYYADFYRSLFTAEYMLMQDEYLTCVSCSIKIIGKVYY